MRVREISCYAVDIPTQHDKYVMSHGRVLDSFPSTVVLAGVEQTQCVVMRLGNAAPLHIGAVHNKLGDTSHHLIVYRVNDTVEKPTPFPCKPFPEYPLLKSFLGAAERTCREFGHDEMPATLDGYVSQILMPSLERLRQQGAVGIKFQTPYYRGLEFADVPMSDAATLYERGIKENGLTVGDHKALQDYIFRTVVTRAGGFGFIVQMHTGLGVRPHFDIAGSNPLLMEPVLRAASGTRFLLLHGGWPFDRETVALLAHDNVYTDFSCANIYKYARALCDQIRPALEWFPEKLMYGTDAYSDRSIAMLAGVAVRPNPLSGWEEKAWLMDRVGRDALGLALTGMHRDGDISSGRASEIVKMVMRENAIGLFGL